MSDRPNPRPAVRGESQRDRGATAVEYALVASLIAVVALVGIVLLGRSLSGSFDDSTVAIGAAVGGSETPPQISASEAEAIVLQAAPGIVVGVQRVTGAGSDSWAVTVARPDGSVVTGFVDASTGNLLDLVDMEADPEGAAAIVATPATPTPTPTRTLESVSVVERETLRASWTRVGNSANYRWECANDFSLGRLQDVRSTSTPPGPAPDCG